MNKREQVENITQRTVHIRTMVDGGIGFFFEHHNKQYLITAGHVIRTQVAALMVGETIRIARDGTSQPLALEVTNVFHDKTGQADVAILELADEVPFPHPSPEVHTIADTYSSQPILMSSMEAIGDVLVVLIRSGTLLRSPLTIQNEGDFFVDLTAYPGFSGSPILYDHRGEYKLIGTAARYFAGNDTRFASPYHRGIIGGFTINPIIAQLPTT